MSENSDSGWTKVERKSSHRRHRNIRNQLKSMSSTSNQNPEKLTIQTSRPASNFELCVRGIAYPENGKNESVWYKFDLTHEFRTLDLLWNQHNNQGIVHSHNNDNDDKFVSDPPYKDSFPWGCYSVPVGARIFCVGCDKNIEGCRDIFAETIGPPITHRNPNTTIRQTQPQPPTNIRVPEENLFHPPSNTSHYIHSLNGSISSELISPRMFPKIVSISERVYLFSANKPPVDDDEYVPFAEYFDPSRGSCFLIQDPPFPRRIGGCGLVVAPLLGSMGEEKILVMSRIVTLSTRSPPPDGFDAHCVYDVHTDRWEEFEDPGEKLFHHLVEIKGDAVAVAEEDCLYWLKSSREICRYNWKTKELLKGYVVELEREDGYKRNKESAKCLCHISANYFCVVWADKTFPEPPIDDLGHGKTTQFHVTVVRMFERDDHLSIEVVKCTRYVVAGWVTLTSAQLLRCY